MAPDRLRKFGELLFGIRWQTELAKALAVSDRTVRRWLSGDMQVPTGVDEELKIMLVKRRAAIEEVLIRRY
jgi:hypothetical protein